LSANTAVGHELHSEPVHPGADASSAVKLKSWCPSHFTQVPNGAFDFYLEHLQPSDFKVLFWTIRRTLGWGSDEMRPVDARSFKQMGDKIRLSRHTVEASVARLVSVGLVIRQGSLGKILLRINRQMLNCPPTGVNLVQFLDKLRSANSPGKQMPPVQKLDNTRPKNGHVAVQKMDMPTKEEINGKETKEMDLSSLVFEPPALVGSPKANHDGRSAIQFIDDEGFHRLEILVGEQIDAPGRRRITAAALQHNFKLDRLEYAFRWHSGMSRAGGLITFADNWELESKRVVRWPSCFHCEDTGREIPPRSKKDVGNGGRNYSMNAFDQAFCNFRIGENAREVNRQGELRPPDSLLHNETSILEFLGQPLEQRAIGGGPAKESALKEEAERRKVNLAVKSEERARIDTSKVRHECPSCDGTKQSNGEPCFACNATGEFWTETEHRERDTCAICHGKSTWPKPQISCRRCSGTGKYIPPFPIKGLDHDRRWPERQQSIVQRNTEKDTPNESR
jgi:hypothetical protein